MSSYKLLLCITLLYCFSCSAEKPGGVEGWPPSSAGDRNISVTSQTGVPATAGPYSLEITPLNVPRNSTIYLFPHGFQASDAKIEWFVNGNPIDSKAPSQFNTAGSRKNDKVQAKATIQGKEILSNVVQIQNSLPEISRVKILPEIFKPGDTLYIEASGSDADGDEVALTYEWTKNGETAGNNKQISSALKKGDKIDVKITPYDGEAYGRPVILHREVLNLPPMIEENRRFKLEGDLYTYQIKATDPDGDTLTYSLKSAPPGMTVDPATGSVKWNVPSGFNGKASFTVSVADGHGGEALQSLSIEIKTEAK